MKKAMYVMALLIIVLLPEMGRAQEPSDNGTIPPYTLWLPMVRMPGCPYEATGVGYWYGTFHGFNRYFVGTDLVDRLKLVEEQGIDLSRFEAQILVAHDVEMENILGLGQSSYSEIYGSFATSFSLQRGETYYAKARIVCIEYPDGEYTKFFGPWTEVASFVVTQPE